MKKEKKIIESLITSFKSGVEKFNLLSKEPVFDNTEHTNLGIILQNLESHLNLFGLIEVPVNSNTPGLRHDLIISDGKIELFIEAKQCWTTASNLITNTFSEKNYFQLKHDERKVLKEKQTNYLCWFIVPELIPSEASNINVVKANFEASVTKTANNLGGFCGIQWATPELQNMVRGKLGYNRLGVAIIICKFEQNQEKQKGNIAFGDKSSLVTLISD